MIKKTVHIAFFFLLFLLAGGFGFYFTLTRIIKSEDIVIIPDLLGKDVIYVLEILTDLGLNTKVKGAEYSAAIPKNHIIHQEPEPGIEIKKGRDVKIIISKGLSYVAAPRLADLSLAQARIGLEENGLKPGILSYTYNFAKERNTVITQSPYSGANLLRGSAIDLLISLGPRPMALMMVDLRGLSLEEAIEIIEDQNLLAGKIKTGFKKNYAENSIINQSPQAGYKILEKSRVNLVINRPAGKQNQLLEKITAGPTLFRYRLANGFIKRHIRVELHCLDFSIDLYNAFAKPGLDLWLVIPKGDNASLFLYLDGDLILTRIID